MIRKRVYEFIENENRDKAGTICEWFLMILILLNVASVVLGSVSELYDRHRLLFTWFEMFSVAVFSIEYLMRLSTAPYKYPGSKSPYLKYIFSFGGLVDLLAILPFFIPFIINADLRMLRLLRMFRLLRVLKLNRYDTALAMIVKVLKNQKEMLHITIFFMAVMILMTAAVMYFVENEAQPERFPSIPATIWWSVATLTTVGYGDVYPVTGLGRLLAGIIAIFGVGLIAMPSGIISMGLIEEAGKAARLKQEQQEMEWKIEQSR